MSLLLPGERVQSFEASHKRENTASKPLLPGSGTCLRDSAITSSVLGIYKDQLISDGTQRGTRNGAHHETFNARGKNDSLSTSSVVSVQTANNRAPHLPRVNDIVLARVTRINPRQATVLILAVGVPGDPSLETNPEHMDAIVRPDLPPYHPQTPAHAFQALIRAQDVRATEKDKVRIPDSFRPGDIVRAVIISLGDHANYYCTTARNDLGAVFATSENGNAMVPKSWCEFWDPVTNLSEPRKSARPF